MPITYEIDRSRRLIRTRCTGPVRIGEVLDHFGALDDDPDRPSHLDVPVDISGMETQPGPEQIGLVADTVPLRGTARMFAQHAGAHFEGVDIFDHHDQAESWLAERTAARSRAPGEDTGPS